MAALTADRNTPLRTAGVESHPVKGATTIFAGALVCLDASGRAVPGSTATGLIVRGRAEENVANAGADGAENVKVRQGIFRWANSASTDAITRAEIGDPAYIVDDQTVAKTNGTNTRSVAGTIRDVDAQGVWVETL
ncbi:hypothetical protein HHL26_04640 [Sphingobium sp. TB-6]|uniref:hypothetical protein n=1 Tax=Sphingobium sp. TB-6 TaxID=2728850 RepID=UPI00146F1FB0|nr:hypothetical protein [Sphingobium sp. TB-6]NML88353.1 hypothetical protein [Sphingobium sp. TB-6]